MNEIEPAMLHSENVRIGAKSLNDYTAFDCYQRGMWHLNNISGEGHRKAVVLFRKAIDRDPQLALGYVGLSRILYGGGTVYGWSEHPDEDLRESFEAAERKPHRVALAQVCEREQLHGFHGISRPPARRFAATVESFAHFSYSTNEPSQVASGGMFSN